MHSLILGLGILISGVSAYAEVQNFNEMIKEASISEKILRRRLLQSLQETKVAIAAVDSNERELSYDKLEPKFEVTLKQDKKYQTP